MLKALVIKELRESAGIIAVAILAMIYALTESQQFEQRIPPLGRETHSRYSGAELQEPLGEPRALEPGVPRHQDVAIPVDVAEHDHQLFHGAVPEDQRSSRWFFSRSVSMACQKP